MWQSSNRSWKNSKKFCFVHFQNCWYSKLDLQIRGPIIQAVVFGAPEFHPNHASTYLADLAYYFFICCKTFNTAFRECVSPQPHVSTHISVFLIQNGNALQYTWTPKFSWPFGKPVLNSNAPTATTILKFSGRIGCKIWRPYLSNLGSWKVCNDWITGGLWFKKCNGTHSIKSIIWHNSDFKKKTKKNHTQINHPLFHPLEYPKQEPIEY